jgi:uncharacterized coiled-coil DUF342 family protein
MGELTRDDLKKARSELRSLSSTLLTLRVDLKDSNEITPEEFKQLAKCQREIDETIDQITLALFDSIVVDIEEPKETILLSINKVEFAIKSLREINQKIKAIKPLVDLFGAVFTAVKSVSVANIGVMVQQIASIV